MTRTFMNPDADYTPNDMGPVEKPNQDPRSQKEIGDSELETIAEHDEQYNLDNNE